jgi:XTP/dITP diphosphohydrolase
MNLLIATRNPHKVREFREILDEPGLVLMSALDRPELPDVEEDGATFEANAVKKAVTLARATGGWAMGDDSGLEVASLGGAPGVFSARYAGEPARYPANNEKLLRALRDRPDRAACFRCVIALASPSGRAQTVEGICRGTIARAPRGAGGFGYDPLFVPDGFDQTFAEMEPAAKHAISHRGRALAAARQAWGDLLGGDPAEWP